MRKTCKVAIGQYGVMLTLGTLILAGRALALPCNGQTVAPGDTLAEVAAKCGQAALKEQRNVSVKETDKSGTRTTTTAIEEWTFDFGPEELMQMYRFEDGRLVEIRNIGYGRQPDDRGEHCQNGQLLAVGDSIVDAYVKCGEPIAKEHKPDKVIETRDAGTKRWTTLSVVEWTYRYGPDLPGYTLRFEDGHVTDIRMREFGK
jgi:hypothetical protein